MSRFHSLLQQLTWFRPIFSTKIFVDITVSDIVLLNEAGVVTQTVPVLVWHRQTHNIVAIGEDARVLEGKHPPNLEVVWPVEQGKVAHTQALAGLLAILIKQQLQNETHSWLIKPNIQLAVVPELSTVDISLWEQVFLQAGAQSVQLSTRSVAGYRSLQKQQLGENICTVEILEDVSVVACFVQGLPVFEKKISEGLISLRRSIRSFLRERFQLVVSHQELAELVATAVTNSNVDQVEGQPVQRAMVRGKHVVTGLPTTVKIELPTLKKEVFSWSERMAVQVSQVLAQLDAGVVTDILETGLVLYGPGATVLSLRTSLAEHCQCQTISLATTEQIVLKGLVDVTE